MNVGNFFLLKLCSRLSTGSLNGVRLAKPDSRRRQAILDHLQFFCDRPIILPFDAP